MAIISFSLLSKMACKWILNLQYNSATRFILWVRKNMGWSTFRYNVCIRINLCKEDVRLTGREGRKPVLLHAISKEEDLPLTLYHGGCCPFVSTVWATASGLGPSGLWGSRNRSELPLLIPAAGFGQGATQTQVGQYPARQVPTGGVNAETGQPMGLIWVHSHF